MKKRLLSMLLSFLMVVTMLPGTTWASGADLTEHSPENLTVQVAQIEEQASAGSWAQAESATFDRVLGSWGNVTDYMNETERAIYSVLKDIIVQQATTGGLMQFLVNQSFQVTHESGASKEVIAAAINTYLDENINTAKITNCLMLDLPYEMYWYDKMSGTQTVSYYSTSDTTTTVTGLVYSFSVYDTYQDKGQENAQIYLSASSAARAEAAAANARTIVSSNQNKSDREKLQAYKDTICELVDYNEEADEITSDPDNPLCDTYYGDPFQILYVFDQNPSTKVVCEGYAKAFQYLCDLSEFDDVQCYSIIGDIVSLGGHMWNIVRLEGQNYLVDVTNCDNGTAGYPNFFFLATPVSGTIENGYYFRDKNGGTMGLTYQALIQSIYPESVLDLTWGKRYMYGTVSISGTPKIGETLTAAVEGTPSGAVLQYQWYRGDTPISGATSRTYTPTTADDVGKTIRVVVSAPGYEGTISARTSGTVVKADGVLPEGLGVKFLEITETSVAIEVLPEYEYACKLAGSGLPTAGEWRDGATFDGVFSGLTPNTQYTIYLRVKETPTHYASSNIGTVSVKTALSGDMYITEITGSINYPIKYQQLPTPSVTVPYTSTSVQWYEGSDASGNPVSADTKAKAGQVYTVYITITATDEHQLGDAITGKFDFTFTYVKGYVTGYEIIQSTRNQLEFKLTFKATEAKAPTGIEITKSPDKTAYYIGDTFDSAGMEVKLKYDDGSSETVSGYAVSPQEMTAGTTSVTVTYQGFSAQVDVTVSKRPVSNASLTLSAPVKYQDLAPSVTVNAPSNITAAVAWYEGNSLIGGPVSGQAKPGQVYTAMITLTAPENYEFTDAFQATLNKEGISVSVSGDGDKVTITKTFPATEERVVTGLAVTEFPDKNKYDVGEPFDPTGMVITATYDDGSSEVVTRYTYSPETIGEDTTEVIISYGGKTVSVPVNMMEYEVTVPSGPGYTVQYDGSTTLPAGRDFIFRVEIAAGYSRTSNFAVRANGDLLAPESDGSYKVTISGETSITVEGVADVTAPSGLVVSYSTDSFREFLSSATFGLFFRDTVTVKISATDEGSGVKEFTYQLGDGELQTVQAQNGMIIFRVEPEFKGSIKHVTAADNDGNRTEETAYEYFAVEKEKPAQPAVNTNGYTGGAWTDEAVTFTVSGSSATGGIAKYQYSADGGKTWHDMTAVKTEEATAETPKNVTQAELTVPGNTQGTEYTFRSVSNAGSESPASDAITVKIDQRTPDISLTGNTASYLQKDTVQIKADVGYSGISRVEVLENDAWTDITQTYQSGYTVTENGTYRFRVINGAGAESQTASITYEKIDPVKPVVGLEAYRLEEGGTVEDIEGPYESGCWTNRHVTTRISNTAPNLGQTKIELRYWDLYYNPSTGQIEEEDRDWWAISSNKYTNAVYNGIFVYTIRVSSESGMVSDEVTLVMKKDRTAPDGNITFQGNPVKKLLNEISFGLFFRENVDVEITATDAWGELDTIEYVKSDKVLNEQELMALTEWTVYDGKFSITAEDQASFIYYVKLTDQAGNVTLFGSDGATFDLTDPVISGIENGAAYCASKNVTVTDENLNFVTLNGEPVSESFTLQGNVEASYTITATDMAGNTTEYTVTMMPIDTLAEPIKALTVDNVTSADKDMVEEVKSAAAVDLEGASEAEQAELKEIADKCDELLNKIQEVAERYEDLAGRSGEVDPNAVTFDERAELETLKEDVEQALADYAGNLTEEENAALEDGLDRIHDALASLEKVEMAEDTISALPETVEPDDTDTEQRIREAKKQYDGLSEHEKTLIAEESKTKLESLLAALGDYEIIRGDGSEWEKGAQTGLSFTANGAYSKFTGIEVDGKAVDKENYTAASGSTVITLKPEYLETLSTGKHTLTVLYTDGETSGEFEVLEKAETGTDTTPETGDSNNMTLWIALLFVSGSVLTAATYRKKKQAKR